MASNTDSSSSESVSLLDPKPKKRKGETVTVHSSPSSEEEHEPIKAKRCLLWGHPEAEPGRSSPTHTDALSRSHPTPSTEKKPATEVPGPSKPTFSKVQLDLIRMIWDQEIEAMYLPTLAEVRESRDSDKALDAALREFTDQEVLDQIQVFANATSW